MVQSLPRGGRGATMIEATGLTKRYGKTVAVNNLSFSVPAGKVTGFLGPNGAGKSPTIRWILGLDNPTGAQVTIGASPYHELKNPLRRGAARPAASGGHPNPPARPHWAWMPRP